MSNTKKISQLDVSTDSTMKLPGIVSDGSGGFKSVLTTERVLFTADEATTITKDLDGTIDTSTTVNGQPLSGDVQLTAADVNAFTPAGGAITGSLVVDGAMTVGGKAIEPIGSIPLPDVWIPFNDSLLIKRGFGEDIKEQGVTVAKKVSFTRASTATYIDKSGVLRTAGVDEPRFEKEGLLIEGASTNVCADSNIQTIGTSSSATGSYWSNGSNAITATVNSDTDILGGQKACKIEVATTGSYKSLFYRTGISSAGAVTYTASVYVKPDSTNIVTVLLAGNGDGSNGYRMVVDLSDGSIITSGTSITTGGIFVGRSVESSKFNGLTKITITATHTDPNGITLYVYPGRYSSQTVGDSVIVSDVQIEPLPFATSYIPTSGAAATRAGDLVKLEPVGNMPMNKMTLSCEWEAKNRWETGANARRHIISSGNATTGYYSCYVYKTTDTTTTRYSGIYSTSGSDLTSTSDIDRDSGVIVMRYDGTKYAMTGTGAGITLGDRSQLPEPTNRTIWLGSANGSIRFINGHIRNFRIWHKALPDYMLNSITK